MVLLLYTGYVRQHDSLHCPKSLQALFQAGTLVKQSKSVLFPVDDSHLYIHTYAHHAPRYLVPIHHSTYRYDSRDSHAGLGSNSGTIPMFIFILAPYSHHVILTPGILYQWYLVYHRYANRDSQARCGSTRTWRNIHSSTHYQVYSQVVRG